MKTFPSIAALILATACAQPPPCEPCPDVRLYELCHTMASCPETQTSYGSCVETLQAAPCQAELDALFACSDVTPLACPLDQHQCAPELLALKGCTGS